MLRVERGEAMILLCPVHSRTWCVSTITCLRPGVVAWVSEKDRKLEQHPDQDVNVPYVRSSDASRARDELGLVANKFSPGSDIRFLRLPLIAPGTIDTSDPP